MKKTNSKIPKDFFINGLTLIISLLVALFIMSNIGGIVGVRESSMEPNLKDGDRLVINRFIYKFSQPNRGDIVILNKKNRYDNMIKNMKHEVEEILGSINNNLKRSARKDTLVKRIIGIPGDEIYIHDGKVYVNGREEEGYSFLGSTVAYDKASPFKLAEDKYFVLGDNREKSLDSRELGHIDIFEIKGRVRYRIWPFEKIGKL